MKEHKIEIRVSYADTDQMDVVYYANYFVWFERGRIEYLRALGLSYKEMEKQNLILPVMEASCSYKAPAHFDDLVIVKTTIKELGRSSIGFIYEVVNKESGQLLAIGETRHPFINRDRKIVRIPEEIRKKLEVQ
ncbi:MAG: thioesterase family protein [bacterium]|jgi:acyl-CoA thioester hydrolase|nr:thioesterase family protein [bacterium]